MQIRPALAAVLLAFATDAFAVTIPTVLVGNAGNPNDPRTGLGGVNYEYRIGVTEITNSQYAEFLNARARVDTFSLYDQNMAFSRGGITKSIVNNTVTYAVKPNMGNKPVNFVDWYDAARFVNWLHNGQGIGGQTESGAYSLHYNAADPSIPLNAGAIARNADAKWWLPSENEWYKAAYHQPNAQGGDTDDYWLYPTAMNSPLIIASANSVGDISNPGARVANVASGADWNGLNGNVTSVGSAGPLSASYYGTFDQAGNVMEWTDTRSVTDNVVRGSSYAGGDDRSSAQRFSLGTISEGPPLGFRVATIPEPDTVMLATAGLLALAGVALRRSRLNAL